MFNKKNRAFTLAEVLITLGVIGVIAAMTVPTLNDGIAAAKNKAQFKKTFATVAQVGKMAARNDLDFTSGNDQQIFGEALSGATSINGSGDLGGYTPSIIKSTVTNIPTTVMYALNRSQYELPDGSLIVVNGNMSSKCSLSIGENITKLKDIPVCFGLIDVNGAAPPNREVRCSNGTAAISSTAGNCQVRNNTTDMGDIFPIVFHDNVVEPATNAAKYVLTHK